MNISDDKLIGIREGGDKFIRHTGTINMARSKECMGLVGCERGIGC